MTPSLYSIASRSEAPRMEDEVRVPIASDVDLLTTSASELSWLRSTASRTRPDRASRPHLPVSRAGAAAANAQVQAEAVPAVVVNGAPTGAST